MAIWIPAAVLVLVVLYFIGVWNGLVRLRNEMRNGWSQIDVQLKRRHDLIPNLVNAVKGYMQHERSTLEAVTQARAAALDASGPAAVGHAESMLGMALGRLFALAENYPDLKASQNFLGLQEELSSTENKIAFARQAYNDAATRYNTAREVFPANMISGGFDRAELFEIETAAERSLPSVNLEA